jgi:arginase
MVIAHLLGRGAPELARMEGPSPLLRPGRLALLGTERLDPQEEPVFDALPSLRLSPREIRSRGASVAARQVLDRIASGGVRFYVHLDLDVLDGAEISAVDFPAPGGLRGTEAGALLAELAGDPAFLGMEVTNFNPDRDPGGEVAKRVVELMGEALGSRDGVS